FGQAGLARPFGAAFALLNAIAIQPDGKILVAGIGNDPTVTHEDFLVGRLTAQGAIDPSFGGGNGYVLTDFGGAPSNNDEAFAMALQPDGKIVVAGDANGPVYDGALARYRSDGSLDSTFGQGGRVITNVGPPRSGLEHWNAVAVQPDGKIAAAGRSG